MGAFTIPTFDFGLGELSGIDLGGATLGGGDPAFFLPTSGLTQAQINEAVEGGFLDASFFVPIELSVSEPTIEPTATELAALIGTLAVPTVEGFGGELSETVTRRQLQEALEAGGEPPPPGDEPDEEGQALLRAIARLLNRLISALPSLLGRVPNVNFPTLPGSRADPFGIPFPTAPQIGLPATQPTPPPAPADPDAPSTLATNVNTLLCLLASRLAQRGCDDAADRARNENEAALARLRELLMPFGQQSPPIRASDIPGGDILGQLSSLSRNAPSASSFPGFSVSELISQGIGALGSIFTARALPPGSGTPSPAPVSQAGFPLLGAGAGAVSSAAAAVAAALGRNLPAVATGVGLEQLLDLIPGGAGGMNGGGGAPGIFTRKGNPRKIGMAGGHWFAAAGEPLTWSRVTLKHPHRHHHHPHHRRRTRKR